MNFCTGSRVGPTNQPFRVFVPRVRVPQGWDDPDVRAVPVCASRPEPVREAAASRCGGVE